MERALTDICGYLNNWFAKRTERYTGTLVISRGQLTLPDGVELQVGQYYRIIGSAFNDGVHKYALIQSLTDETFEGSIWAMRVPLQVVGIAEELDGITDGDGSAGRGLSPYSSESLTAGGYSYTRATSSDGTPLDIYGLAWLNALRKLRRWRKLP